EKMERLARLVRPFLTSHDTLTREDWLRLQEAFRPYADALAKKPAARAVEVTVPPTGAVDNLGQERITAILDSDVAARFSTLADEDAAVPAAAADIAMVERLVLYYRHLYRLLINFVNFQEFYRLQSAASFQSGQLFIDGRACHLCMPAGKVEEHARLAANSHMYLLYCECVRGRKVGDKEAERQSIMAAVTAGTGDILIPGRNGVYVDTRGDDWDATVVKVVSNPISLWQALWTPYRKLENLISDQVSKYSREREDSLAVGAGKAVVAAASGRFDIGRSVGIFAAVGLAVGTLGTAIGSLLTAFFHMSWWQFPVLVFGVFVLISGPSLIMAWIKLRQRTLGPLLEASGWAVNGRVGINHAVSRRLTRTAKMPPNSRCRRDDPLAKLRYWQKTALIVSCVACILATTWWLWQRDRHRVHPGKPSSPTATIKKSENESSWHELLEAFKQIQEQAATATEGPTAVEHPSATTAPPAPGPAPAAAH
ncbi:MAG: hypothetical protein LIP77_11255, partial [Planctomycetes bacterium]|nr:hypothetical protein [Planctomycetota bacterium]